ncbi:hypothetical protein B0T40_15600 [Chromobacterium haemolyticum]|uniref:hypothetical protein n=1 Tax=Chromobacterium haemolyticum TaxID=394935 RepID=UPI0009D9B27C|nr:hypothetical protein [Chromobacterium haemolyticum]OQS34267.1 hypothetical protein B0T40_15600 [Chromobacterium haemolyticum]
MANCIFLIEGGLALELVKTHIAERKAVRAAAQEMAKELGVTECVTSRFDGHLIGVCFPGERHPDFTVPDRKKGVSYPKKKSAWEKRFGAAPRFQCPAAMIEEAFNVPTFLSYKEGQVRGRTCIGHPLFECGFLFFENGPYAMWIPDVQGEVARMEAEGKSVEEPARSFVPEFDGCRRIEQEEWDILVAQHKLEKKRKQSEGVAA